MLVNPAQTNRYLVYARLKNGDVIKNPPRPLSKSIDQYPMAAWDLILFKVITV